MTAAARATRAFAEAHGGSPQRLVQAPGRVNLIGDHTDYQDGLVLPMAIDRTVAIALRERDDGRVDVTSADAAHPARMNVEPVGDRTAGWGVYLQGVAWALSEAGARPRGFDGAVASDVPVGAGLSSSAALELAAALAFLPDAASRPDARTLARLAQRAETEWVGTNCGLMDQLASACGVAGHALLIDCRAVTVEPVLLPADVTVLVLDTATRRELAGSDYNTRRHETGRAAAALGMAALRGADPTAVAGLDEPLRSRARHVVTENARVRRFAAAIAAGDLPAAGAEMAASHASLRDNFAVVTPELDAIVEICAGQAGCHGARMSGGGFGGCAVALVAAGNADAVREAVKRRYADRVGRHARVWACAPADGAAEIAVPAGKSV